MRLRLAELCGLKFLIRKEAFVYNPELREIAVKTLYRLKRALKKPMTEILDEMLMQSLKAFDRGSVCRVCVDEKNNQCEECYLSERRVDEGYYS